MIKMLVSARKIPGMTDQAYSDHWGGHHGDIVRAHGADMGFRRYIQSHLLPIGLPAALRGTEGPNTPKNGQAELWWDSVDAMVAAASTPEGQAASQLFEEDERRFCDVTNLSAFLAVETVLHDVDPASRFDGSDKGVKLFVELVAREGGVPFEQWIGGYRAFTADAARALRAYRHIVDRPLADDRFDFAKARGWRPAPDAVIEMWFAGEANFRAAFDGEAGLAWKREVARYADIGSLCPLVARPRVIFDNVSAEAA